MRLGVVWRREEKLSIDLLQIIGFRSIVGAELGCCTCESELVEERQGGCGELAVGKRLSGEERAETVKKKKKKKKKKKI